MLPIKSCTPLDFGVSTRSSERFGRINMRGFLGSPPVIIGKGLKLTRNCLVGHALGRASKVSAVFRHSLPRCEIC
jgi:hypothetical protein